MTVPVALPAPLERTAAFTAFAEALMSPDRPLPRLLTGTLPVGEPPVRAIPGINGVLRRSAETPSLPSELGVAWAEAPRTYR
jgi:hypothetical protein